MKKLDLTTFDVEEISDVQMIDINGGIQLPWHMWVMCPAGAYVFSRFCDGLEAR